MNLIEKLEAAIQNILANIDENERIDRITKEKLENQIANLYDITGEMKDSHDNTWDALHAVLDSLNK